MRRQPGRLGLNLTSMIDVVFLLLVYFMTVTEFRLGEEVYRLDLPRRGAAADPYALPREPVRISVATTGAGYSIRVTGLDAQPLTFEQLHEVLRAQRRRGGAGLLEPDHPIVVEPAETASWEHAVSAFNAAARARYTNITFAPTS